MRAASVDDLPSRDLTVLFALDYFTVARFLAGPKRVAQDRITFVALLDHDERLDLPALCQVLVVLVVVLDLFLIVGIYKERIGSSEEEADE